MKLLWPLVVVFSLLVSGPPATALQPRIKVLADQDSAGPEGTNYLSLLMLLMAPEIELLGITTVSGDQWVKQSTVFARHAIELAGRPDVPVVQGAEMPLLNSRSEQERRERLFGSYPTWHGVFNPDTPPPDRTWEPPGGWPKTEARAGHAVDFIIETIRRNPGEVVLYCAGPLTNVALAVRLDPGIVELTRSIYIMGGKQRRRSRAQLVVGSRGGRDRFARAVEGNCGYAVRDRRPGVVERRTHAADCRFRRSTGRSH